MNKDFLQFHLVFKNYVALLKLRVMFLVAFTGGVGLLFAPGYIPPYEAIIVLLCIAFGGGGAGAINMWYDADIDGVMKRTCKRPVPSNKISAKNALIFGVIVSLVSVGLLYCVANFLSAFLLLLAILFYVFVYTMFLKRSSVHGIVIGGLVGGFAPLIGWSAVEDSIDVFPLLLGGIVFVWNMPHFWSLALFLSNDYEDAGIPMMPVVYGEGITKYYIMLYSLSLISLTIVPYFFMKLSVVFLCITLILNCILGFFVFKVYCCSEERYYKSLFVYSILYLFLYFLGMIFAFLL